MKNKMTDVRNLMIEGMESLLDEESAFDAGKAKQMANLGKVLIDSAKVEVDFLRVTGSTADAGTGFLELEVKNEPKKLEE